MKQGTQTLPPSEGWSGSARLGRGVVGERNQERIGVAKMKQDASGSPCRSSAESVSQTRARVDSVQLRPFFSYFGGKWTLAPHYPPPAHLMLVEPFAGSAGYATRYPDREVVLVEREPRLATMWRWLIGVSVDEVMGLPLDPAKREGLPAGAQHLIGFWSCRGRTSPTTTVTSSWLTSGKWPSSFWGEYARARVAAQVQQIRHWRIIEGDYTDAPDTEATWFIDPPYEAQPHRYRARIGSYPALGRWCRTRRGLAIVCEQEGARWLPFRRFRTAKSIARGTYNEVSWVSGIRTESR